ncbi:hypothetical protein ACM55K_10685 [Flavobacterium sp. LT1R49]|uniref:hypothetical protein n=1 Tax=Flavobacterium arabinosi TaxID=3398737 RepID=UPI003A8BFAE9
MSKLTSLQIQAVFNKIKALAQKEFENKNYELSLKYIEDAADLAYSFNWKYSDEDLEDLLILISGKIITKKTTFTPIKGRVVFYDVFALDNRGLTQQYLRALISWGAEILFVFEGNDLASSKQILSEIKSYSKAELFVVDKSLSKTERIKSVYNKVVDFKPEKAFLHLLPSSAIAVSIWNALKEVTRYQVNLTDHAFWLGTKCIDYSLEFRDYGCTVSSEKRGLSESMLLMQPYYPIIDCKPFIGFPKLIPSDAIKIFTGGAYYKMYGKSGMFFKLLKTLINLNPKVVILLAGNGDESPIRDFILKNKYENKLFLLGSRSDITHVFDNCEIYLSTFPITGGLMGQYAASLAKPILSYSSEDIPCNYTEGFINWNRDSDYKITHTTLDSFKAEALKLIESKSYREEKGKEIKKHIITEKEFSVHLKQLVTSHKMGKPFKKETIDYDVFDKLYLESENKYLKKFDFFIVSRFKFKAIFLFPKNVIAFIINQSNWQLFFRKFLK